MRNVLSILICLFTISVINAQDGLPTNPKPGACYVKCVTADEFRTVEENHGKSGLYQTRSGTWYIQNSGRKSNGKRSQ